jgi:hypothetical protein
MELQNRAGLLWMIFLLISVCFILVDYVGWMPVIEYGLVSILSFIGWLKFSFRQRNKFTGLVPIYILSIVLFLFLAFLQYVSNYHTYLFEKWHRLMVPNLSPDYTHWFLVFVCFPVSFLLIGGYFLTKEKFLGSFFAWWAFFYFLISALLHLSIELNPAISYPHYGYLGALLAMALFLTGAYGIIFLVRGNNSEDNFYATKVITSRQVNLWSILFICLVLLYAVTLYEQAGLLPVGIIGGSMMGGMLGWRTTTAHRPADPYKVVPIYLLLQALFYIHVGEETLTHFSQAIANISNHPWNERDFNFFITLGGPIIWIFAAWSLWKRQPFGNFILWFIIVGMILGEPTHFLVFPVIRMVQQGVRYQYFPGMYTALFPMIPAILALGVILQDHRKIKTMYGNSIV